MVHDLYYRYGFDEVAGNFQNHNFGKGGEQNDAVIANAQDGSDTYQSGNAFFASPPDGQRGEMLMYLWNTATPLRDGDLDAGLVIHEYTHGLSTRLTGGPELSCCLPYAESAGLGEGWSDFLATMIRSTSNYSDYPFSAWVENKKAGMRPKLYSLDMKINPTTYETLNQLEYLGIHAMGSVYVWDKFSPREIYC